MHDNVARRGGARRCLLLVLSLSVLPLALGCQAPAARIAGCDNTVASRGAAIAGQLARDSAIETATHPLRTTASAVSSAADLTWASAEGLFCKRLLLPLCPSPPPVAPDRPQLDPQCLEEEMRRRTGQGLRPAHVELQHDGDKSLAAVEALIERATCRLDVLMFMWENDEVGRGLAERLAARARQGVAVRVLVDGGGNLIYGKPKPGSPDQVNAAVCWLAHQPGVALLRTRTPFARFDHRKLVLADGLAAWSGGRNFNRNSFFAQHDATFTVAGPLVAEFQQEFDHAWHEAGGPPAPPLIVPAGAWPDGPFNTAARLVGTGPLRHDFRDAVLLALDRARHHIYLENPFVCDPRVVVRLIKARRRGVDVRVVLTLDTTTPVMGEANRVTANRLFRAGVRVYLRAGMTHLKAVTVDGCWAYLGSGNFDALSLRSDYELGVAFTAGPVILAMEQELIGPDLRPEWEMRSLLPLSLTDRLAEMLASLVL